MIQGTGFENVGAMHFTVLYDTSSLGNPRVVQGALISGAMMMPNATVPGSVQLGIIRVTPIQGSGVIATLTFDRTGSSAGKILSVAVKNFSNVNGRSEASRRRRKKTRPSRLLRQRPRLPAIRRPR